MKSDREIALEVINAQMKITAALMQVQRSALNALARNQEEPAANPLNEAVNDHDHEWASEREVSWQEWVRIAEAPLSHDELERMGR